MKYRTTITPILHSRITSDGRQYVKIRVTQNRKSKFINLNFKIKASEWNDRLNRVKSNCKGYVEYNQTIENELERLKSLTNVKTNHNSNQFHKLYTPVLEILQNRYSFDSDNPDHYSSEKKLKTSINHFINSGLSHIKLCEYTPEIAMKFDNFLRKKSNLQPSSIGAYHRVIRSTLNAFCKINRISRSTWEDPYEIKLFEISRKSAPKFALKEFEIHILEEYMIFKKKKDSVEFTSLCMFLFSYFSFGQRFGDIFKLHWNNYKNGNLDMKSEKTRQHLRSIQLTHKQTNILKYFSPIREFYITGQLSPEKKSSVSLLFPELEKLLNLEEKYMSLRIKHTPISIDELSPELFNGIQVDLTLDPSEDEKEEMESVIRDRDELLMNFILKCCYYMNDPIFPFYPKNENDKRKVIHRKESSNAVVNRELKKICLKLELRKVSFHHARHSFAHNIRLSKKFDVLQISKALNHSSLDVTTTYLNSFEDDELNDAHTKWIDGDMNKHYPI